MRSLPAVLRTLAGIPFAGSEHPAVYRAPAGARRRAATGTGPGPARQRLELERVETMLRRLQTGPGRIDNPFDAFPTRSFWLGKLMDEHD